MHTSSSPDGQGISQPLHDQLQDSSNNAKDDKNNIRLAAIIHVLCTLIELCLNQDAGDAPRKISARTMSAAIALAGYFEKQRAILRQVNIFMNHCSFYMIPF